MLTTLPGSYRLGHFGRLSLIVLILLGSFGGLATAARFVQTTATRPAPASLAHSAVASANTDPAAGQLPAELYAAVLQRQQAEGGQAYALKSATPPFPSEAKWLATNPAHGLALSFEVNQVNINGWGLEVASFGDNQAVAPRPSASDANRLEYQHANGLTEWYVNGPLGLEQGFTLAQPLPQTAADGWLNLPVTFKGAQLQANSPDNGWLKLVGPSGEGLGRYGKLYASDAKGQVLESRLEIGDNSQRATLRVKLSGANYPVVIDPFIQQAELIASDGTGDDTFGYSVGLSSDGNTAIVGAFQKAVGPNTGQGAAYIFTRAGTVWSQQAKLTASDGATSDNFGVSVALSGDGNTAIVGAYNKTFGANSGQGAAYVFTRSGTAWSQQQELTASDPADSDFFSYSVALSNNGNTAIIGAYGKTLGGNANRGAAYIFTRAGTAWSQQTELTATDGAASDTFGYSVGLSSDGNTAIVGAYGKTIGANAQQGAAYIFTRAGTAWSQQQQLTASDGADSDNFGYSVALSSDSNTALVGAYTKKVGPNFNQGAAYVFTRAGTTWTQQTELTASDGAASDNFGVSVALSGTGNAAIVGANFKKVGPNLGQGAAYVFNRTGTAWSQQQQLTASDGADSDYFGYAVALSSDSSTALVGANGKKVGANFGQGAVYTFSFPQPTTTTLTSSPNPSIISQTVTFTASVAPVAATGTVTFTEGATVLATTSLVNGTAVYTTSSLPIGSHSIVATYGGNASYAGSTSQPLNQVVQAACQPLVVTSITDDGSGTACGTLSYALAQPVSTSVTITFALTQGSTITFTGSLATTAKVKSNVTIVGGTFGNPARITLNGNGVAGDGLHLAGSDYLVNLTVKGFAARQIVLEGTNNHFQGVVVNAS